MKENKMYKKLVIFFVAAFMCFGSASFVIATPFTGTPSPSLSPVFGELIDFDDQPTGTLVGEFDYVDQGVASITETEGIGPLARFAGTQSQPNYIGTGSALSWDGTILIEFVYPTNKAGIGIADNEGGETLTIYDASMEMLETQPTTGTTQNGYYGFERSTFDIKYLEITGDWFAVDDLQFNRVDFEAEKVITDAEYDPPEFVPIYTNAWWDLKITVENTGDVDLDEIWVYDGIGAKLDLVIQNDGVWDYIFTLDGTPLYFDGGDNEYFGETGPVSWALANGKAPKANGKHSATTLTWDAEELDIGDTKELSFRVQTIPFQTGKDNKNDKQAFTSTCHHYLNDGPIAMVILGNNPYYYWGEPVMVSVYSLDPEADSDGDGYYDVGEVAWGSDPCDSDSHPIFVGGFNSDRGRSPLGSGGADYLEGELLNTDNFGFGGIVPCPVVFINFVQTIDTESLVDGDGNLLVDVFFAGLTATDLTTDEADELKAFLEAGGILFLSGNSLSNEGPSYNPLFTALGWSDYFTTDINGDNGESTSTPISTPVTTGPFGTCGPLTYSPFRDISVSTATAVAMGTATGDGYCIIAEASVGSNGGYISIIGDPLFFDMFVDPVGSYYDVDNLNYFLNLFALAV